MLSQGTVPATPAGASVRGRPEDGRLQLDGRWTADQAPAVEAAAARIAASGRAGPLALDLSGIERLDTLGAWVLERTRAEIEQAGGTFAYLGCPAGAPHPARRGPPARARAAGAAAAWPDRRRP